VYARRSHCSWIVTERSAPSRAVSSLFCCFLAQLHTHGERLFESTTRHGHRSRTVLFPLITRYNIGCGIWRCFIWHLFLYLARNVTKKACVYILYCIYAMFHHHNNGFKSWRDPHIYAILLHNKNTIIFSRRHTLIL
jgi:hypothetical protein